jgi:hypothetical protein
MVLILHVPGYPAAYPGSSFWPPWLSLAAAGGTASPVALAGIIVTDLTANMNLPGAPLKVFYAVSAVHLVAGILFYIGLGGYKIQARSFPEPGPAAKF